MSNVELRDVPDPPSKRDGNKPRNRIARFLITTGIASVAIMLAWKMWEAYMSAPWTRDGQVRAYVVKIAPEVAGRIVQLPVIDNQFVHKGDLLMTIDPTDYKIAVDLAEAAVQQAQVSAQNLQAEAKRREKLLRTAATSVEEEQTYESNASVARAAYQRAMSKCRPGAGKFGAHSRFGLQLTAISRTSWSNLMTTPRSVKETSPS